MADQQYWIGIPHHENSEYIYYLNVKRHGNELCDRLLSFISFQDNVSQLKPTSRKTKKGIKQRLAICIQKFKDYAEYWKKHHEECALDEDDAYYKQAHLNDAKSYENNLKQLSYYLDPSNWIVYEAIKQTIPKELEYKEFSTDYRQTILNEVVGLKQKMIYCVSCGHVIPKEMFCLKLKGDVGICPLCLRDLDLTKRSQEAISQMDKDYVNEWEIGKSLKEIEIL